MAIPVHNESGNVDELIRRLSDMFSTLSLRSSQILFVDDGSDDDTLARLKAIAVSDPKVTVIALSRNFGHQAALTAALDYVDADAVVLMDGDLQDAPEDIPLLLAEYERGYDVVYAVRIKRKEGILLRAGYRTFYWLMRRLSSTPLPEEAGDFGLLSRRVVETLRRYREQHRYLRGLRTWVGFRQVGVEVERRTRHAGSSQYGVTGLLALAVDGVFSFSTIPIRMASLGGIVAILGSGSYAGYALWAKFFREQTPQGFTTLILAMVFLAGVQLLFLGVIGEYVGRIYEEAKARPLYIVDTIVGDLERGRED